MVTGFMFGGSVTQLSNVPGALSWIANTSPFWFSFQAGMQLFCRGDNTSVEL